MGDTVFSSLELDRQIASTNLKNECDPSMLEGRKKTQLSSASGAGKMNAIEVNT